MVTGKRRGFKVGDFVHTGAFPGIIIADVGTYAPCCEVWGFEHEMGSAYATDLVKLSYQEFLTACQAGGYTFANLAPYSKVSKKALEAVA